MYRIEGMRMNIEGLCLSCFNQKENDLKCSHCGFQLATYQQSPHQLPSQTILAGRYLVGTVLGEGGFGITYIGYDLNLEMKVAIKEYYPNGCVTRESTNTKTVHPYIGDKGEFFLQGKEKFLKEAKTLAKFSSYPGVVSVRDFFLENGTAYIVMEYVEGETLKEYLAKHGGKISSRELFSMILPVMQSLGQIHQEGIIHRDISPENIMIDCRNQMKLLDFGAARDFAESGNKSLSVMLKPGYAPEEQYRSRGVQGPWTDVYALCATMYKCLTGEVPLESNERIWDDGLQMPSARGVVIKESEEQALMKGLAVRQENRYQSVIELVAALYPTEEELNQQNMYRETKEPVQAEQPQPEPPQAEQPHEEPQVIETPVMAVEDKNEKVYAGAMLSVMAMVWMISVNATTNPLRYLSSYLSSDLASVWKAWEVGNLIVAIVALVFVIVCMMEEIKKRKVENKKTIYIWMVITIVFSVVSLMNFWGWSVYYVQDTERIICSILAPIIMYFLLRSLKLDISVRYSWAFLLLYMVLSWLDAIIYQWITYLRIVSKGPNIAMLLGVIILFVWQFYMCRKADGEYKGITIKKVSVFWLITLVPVIIDVYFLIMYYV